ncbi:Bifunctional lysine-specific demethylase and histidyl-hydroxylase NO66 [Porphyridium purpureum]|uniref:Bifunctional lysine-specific demethylase and histidyl-hydroxylase n=1 Tax=Porphyridium purpureum TaxID=35688 RepID=A0A5J4YZ28_PORPP|nr:Bifunctional lysine-specific demethylase and histidyl-hydroxylase NO66 [Porphyridium purpureum]|eukprot:POR8153..scf208_2
MKKASRTGSGKKAMLKRPLIGREHLGNVSGGKEPRKRTKRAAETQLVSATRSECDLVPMNHVPHGDKNPGVKSSASHQEMATAVLRSLLSPSGCSVPQFYQDVWEKKPLLVSWASAKAFGCEEAEYRTRLRGILSLQEIRRQLETRKLHFGTDINVTAYADHGDGKGKYRANFDRMKDDDEGQVRNGAIDPDKMWKGFEEKGWTIRMLCPHKLSDSVHALLSTLETEFGCMVGANAYLTPGGHAQGFAPHYDDIEAFVLQLEGEKRWRVYAPLSKEDTLPRASSPDFSEADLSGCKPVIDCTLQPGDVLYMPRGWIHHANTEQESKGHSLHLTVSVMQNWSWADFLDILFPQALTAVVSKNQSMRQGLPLNFQAYMGVMHEPSDPVNESRDIEAQHSQGTKDEDAPQDNTQRLREQFRAEASSRIMRVCKRAIALIDAGCDDMAVRFLSDRQSPALSAAERLCTSAGGAHTIDASTACRLVRPGVARLTIEGDKAVVYHCAANGRVYHERALSPLDFELDDAPALETLLTTIEPHWVLVSDLSHETGSDADKVGIAQALFDEGILSIRTPHATTPTGALPSTRPTSET